MYFSAFSMHGEKRNEYKILGTHLKGTDLFRRTKRRWEENIDMVKKYVGCKGVD